MWSVEHRWSGWRYDSRRVVHTFTEWGIQYQFKTKRHQRSGYVLWSQARIRTMWTGPRAIAP